MKVTSKDGSFVWIWLVIHSKHSQMPSYKRVTHLHFVIFCPYKRFLERFGHDFSWSCFFTSQKPDILTGLCRLFIATVDTFKWTVCTSQLTLYNKTVTDTNILLFYLKNTANTRSIARTVLSFVRALYSTHLSSAASILYIWNTDDSRARSSQWQHPMWDGIVCFKDWGKRTHTVDTQNKRKCKHEENANPNNWDVDKHGCFIASSKLDFSASLSSHAAVRHKYQVQ